MPSRDISCREATSKFSAARGGNFISTADAQLTTTTHLHNDLRIAGRSSDWHLASGSFPIILHFSSASTAAGIDRAAASGFRGVTRAIGRGMGPERRKFHPELVRPRSTSPSLRKFASALVFTDTRPTFDPEFRFGTFSPAVGSGPADPALLGQTPLGHRLCRGPVTRRTITTPVDRVLAGFSPSKGRRRLFLNVNEHATSRCLMPLISLAAPIPWRRASVGLFGLLLCYPNPACWCRSRFPHADPAPAVGPVQQGRRASRSANPVPIFNEIRKPKALLRATGKCAESIFLPRNSRCAPQSSPR